ncbi:AbrB/MazE/SpoVT family DNA-binding domain-containing protein [Pseudomonas citronellolis]|uniref:AbrB/MazE/SpoVT family DNA-binding domain-containing protein n=1 Tax=Pseudomonas citronellolis TaxID=53408 RepID=A0AAW6P3L9_9PSED|nr:hypothetical protein [Pseudomonas citronellolis]MDF3842286.1 AbrB/MazE/SpoVT family DNA-binding domain-containing protein [Pseudomonas citronellolis]
MSNDKDADSFALKGESKNTWRVVCEHTNDGSGDVIISLPDELCDALAWTVGDVLTVELGHENTWVLSKKKCT